MENLGSFILDLLAQFGGGRGPVERELVRTGLEATFWGLLLGVSLWRKSITDSPRERLLVAAFSLGLARAVLLFLVFSFEILGIFAFRKSHLFFPPLEHAFLLASVVLVAAGFIRFLLQEEKAWWTYLAVGMGVVVVDYAATAVWWMRHIFANPSSRFGLVWADQLFHLSGILLIGWAMFLLWRTKGGVRNLVVIAMGMFLLDDLIQMVNLVNGDNWGKVTGPIRHNLHNLAIPVLGVVYLQELFSEWRSMELAKNERESRYRRLFADLDRGVMLVELVRDPKGAALDYRILDINRAGESATGMKGMSVVGRLGSVVIKGPRPPFLGLLARADAQGLDRVFKVRAGKDGKRRQVELFPLSPGRIAVTVSEPGPHHAPAGS